MPISRDADTFITHVGSHDASKEDASSTQINIMQKTDWFAHIKSSIDNHQEMLRPEGSYWLRHWHKILDKICIPNEGERVWNYYYDTLPLRPGTFVDKVITQSHLPIQKLKMKIPETLCNFMDMAWITYDYETGKLNLKTEDFLIRNYGEHL